jgi:hypothetical protein
MANVRVYRYEVFNAEQGMFLDTTFEVYATLEKINALSARAQFSVWRDVEPSELNERGFYHPTSTPA